MLMSNDLYEISVHYAIDTIHYRSIQLLYQPLIGYEAASIYQYLWAEVDQISLTKAPCYHLRMAKSLDMPLRNITSALKKLEAIGLLNTYKKEDEEVCYLYELLLPLTPTNFFKHQILNTLLYKKLGKEDYQRTKVCFTTFTIDKSKYKNVTASFQDVFSIQLDKEDKNCLSDNEYLRQESNPIERDYPLDLFYAGLHEYQIKKDSLSKEDESIIRQLGTLYKVNVLDMLGIVKKTMENDVLNYPLLMKECRTYYDLQVPTKFTNVHHKQGIQHKSTKVNGTVNSHIEYLENISPIKLLKAKQGGKEPVRKDLVIIESLMTKLGLEPGVINVLIEMTLKECAE
ncbi:MAG: replication initiation protein, partial [Coprobacillaceae bacterium]